MTYRIFRILETISQGYPLAIFWLYVGSFIFSLPLIFVFPPGALILIFLALAGLPVWIALGGALRLLIRGLARWLIARGICPRCAGIGPSTAPEVSARWRCPTCQALFQRSGLELPMDVAANSVSAHVAPTNTPMI